MALEAQAAAYDHLTEDALERYAFGRLPHADLANFEEHLLFCEHCQQRLEAEDNFVEAMLVLARVEKPVCLPVAAGQQRPPHPRVFANLRQFLSRGKPVAWRAWQAPIGVIGLMSVIALGWSLATWLMPGPVQIVQTVHLKTLRGGGHEGVADASSRRTLELSIEPGEIEELAATPALDGGAYRLEIVDAAGNQAWTGKALSSVSGEIKARVERPLIAGVYWVRLYAGSGKLLREFSLHVG